MKEEWVGILVFLRCTSIKRDKCPKTRDFSIMGIFSCCGVELIGKSLGFLLGSRDIEILEEICSWSSLSRKWQLSDLTSFCHSATSRKMLGFDEISFSLLKQVLLRYYLHIKFYTCKMYNLRFRYTYTLKWSMWSS